MIVAVIWTALLLAALGLVRTYGTRTLPQADELWVLYDAGPGIHLQWLWHTWAEHRIPLAKLIWKSVLELTGYDFRAGDFLTVLALAGTAFLLIWTAKQVRGRVILADAFFPLTLLNLGQAQLFLWWWQINHVLAPVIASMLLSVLLVRGNDLQLRHIAGVGVALVVLVLCGPGGLPYVLMLAVWLIAWGIMHRRYMPLISAFAVVSLALLALYFVNYHPYFPVNDPPTLSSWAPSPGLASSGLAFLQILGLSLGTATKAFATWSGLAVLGFALITAVALLRLFITRPSEQWRASAMMALLAAQAALVLVLAWSRAGMGLDYIYQGHYLTIMAPVLCCLYFVWEIRGGRASRAIQLGMAAVLAVLLPINFIEAQEVGRGIQAESVAFERDVRNGVPASVLAEHHFASDVVPRAEKLTLILRTQKANGIGIFREMRDDPQYRVERLPEAGITEGNDAINFSLPHPQHVYAVRLHYGYIHTSKPFPTLQVQWRNSQSQAFGEDRAFGSTVAGPDQPTWALIDGKIHTDAKIRSDRTLTVWIDTTIDEIRIYPDAMPSELRLSDVLLLD